MSKDPCAAKVLDMITKNYPYYLEYIVHLVNRQLLRGLLDELIDRRRENLIEIHIANSIAHDIRLRLDVIEKTGLKES